MTKTTVATLKATIKGLTVEKVTLTETRTNHKRGASPERKQAEGYNDWFVSMDERRAMVRYQIRHHLLAYAYVRGRAYRTVERHSLSKPQASTIEGVLRTHGHYPRPVEVEAWLDTPAEGAFQDLEAA